VPLHLGPILGDIVEVFGVGRDLLEQRPGFFECGQVLFLLVLATAAMNQAVVAQDALDGGVTQGQVPFALQAAGTESGQLTTQRDHPRGPFAPDLVGAGVGGARDFLQALQALRLIASSPLAHGRDGGEEGAGGGLDPVLTGMRDQAEAVIKSVLHLTNHIEVRHGSRHGPRILRPPPAALVPPHQGSHLPPPLLTQALQPHRGDTMYQGYSILFLFLTPLKTPC